MYLRYALYILLDLIMTIIGLFIIPVGLLFCINDKRTGKDVHMGLLWWPWDNEWDGINYLGYGTGFWERWNWLAIRNHTRNFGAFVVGVEKPLGYRTRGDPLTTDGLIGQAAPDVPGSGHAGWKRLDTSINGKDYFLFYLIYQYPFRKDKCLRLKLGWKLDTGTDRAEIVYTPNPWKGFAA